jgi:two-component sensor histidine kinase
MLDDSINLLEELDSVSKIHILDRDDIDSLMIEFARRIIATLHIERVNVWLFNQEKDAIVSIAEYDLRTQRFSKESVLLKKDYPAYFQAIQENTLILVPDIVNHPFTKQFSETYSKPNDIISLMDIPFRIGGELVGVICFEKTGDKQRVFSEKEQTFALSVSLVLASNLEARHRRAAQFKLEQLLKEKEMLIQEINHRVKNNFSVLISLLRISRMQGPKVDAATILSEYEQRIMSMLKIQELLSRASNYSSINFSDYLSELVKEFKVSYPEIALKMGSEFKKTAYEIPSKMALHLGLIVTEIFLNAAKHAFPGAADFKLMVSLKEISGKLILEIHDNGKGFDFQESLKKNSLGLSLIRDLVSDMDLHAEFPRQGHCAYTFTFSAPQIS